MKKQAADLQRLDRELDLEVKMANADLYAHRYDEETLTHLQDLSVQLTKTIEVMAMMSEASEDVAESCRQAGIRKES